MGRDVSMEEQTTYAEIDLRAISHNLKEIQKKVSPAKVMAVVKADAYGHGILRVAETAVTSGAAYLGVARVEEGVQLRKNGITSPILVFGGFFENQISAYLVHNLTATVYDFKRVQMLSQAARKAHKTAVVHIKVDTGMGRVGVNWQDAPEFVTRVLQVTQIELEGVYSHFASSDTKDKSYAALQLQRFNQVLSYAEQQNIRIPLKHIANSGAILDMENSYFDMVRAGVMMYGYYPSTETTESVTIKPAMTLASKIIAVKEVEAGTAVSYNSTYKTDRRTRIATVPIGYGDGYNRLLSNRGTVLIRGKRFPVVGRVCMDQIMVDLGSDDAQTGDDVILMGRQRDEEISIYEVCHLLSTIPYEVTCLITKRVPRKYI